MAKDYMVVKMVGNDRIHLEGFSPYQTLCGHCDDDQDQDGLASEIGAVNCKGCIDALRHARKITRTMVKT